MYEDVDKKQMDRKMEKYERAMRQREGKGLERVDMKTWENELIERKQAREEARKNAESEEGSTPSSQPSTKADELDEEDKKIISETKKMGYCYFKEHADKVEQHLKSFKSQNSIHTTPEVAEVKENKAISSWNAHATTYEEKDVTKWALEAFDYYIRGTATKINVGIVLNMYCKLDNEIPFKFLI